MLIDGRQSLRYINQSRAEEFFSSASTVSELNAYSETGSVKSEILSLENHSRKNKLECVTAIRILLARM